MENKILMSFTGLDGATTALTGSGDYAPTPTLCALPQQTTPSTVTVTYDQKHHLKRTSSSDVSEKGDRTETTDSGSIGASEDGSNENKGEQPIQVKRRESEVEEDKEELTTSTDTEEEEGESDIEVDEDGGYQQLFSLAPHSLSYRSVKCPQGGCGRTVAAADFLSHFRHEHPSVALARLSPHHRLAFALAPGCLRPASALALCVALVKLTGNCEELLVYSPDECEGADEWVRLRRRAGSEVAICALLGRVETLQGGAALAVWCACLFNPNDRPPVAYTLRAAVDRHGVRTTANVHRCPVDSLRGGHGGGGLLLPLPPPDTAIQLRLRFHRLVPTPTPCRTPTPPPAPTKVPGPITQPAVSNK